MQEWCAKYCLWLLILWFPVVLRAQHFNFREYGPTEGLTSLDVNCLLQDRAGFLWVGTDNGLFRYNGDRFEAFTRANGLPNVEITSLAESPSGVLWVATQGGLAARHGREFQPLAGLATTPIAGIAFDRAGALYASGLDGLFRGTPSPTGTYALQRMIAGEVTAFKLEDADLLYSQHGDLWRLQGGRAERFGSTLQLPSAQWEDLARDSKGRLWVRSVGKLFVQEHEGGSFADRSAGIPSATRGRLYPDPHGGMFVSTNEGAVLLQGDQRWFIDAKHGFPDIAVAPILITRDQSMWLGTRGTGVLRRLGHGEWLSWQRHDGLLNNTVWSILSDTGGRLWVGTAGGLSVFADPGGPLQGSWNTHSALGSDEILSIAQDPRSKDVFVGGNPGSLSRFDRQGHFLGTFGTSVGLTREHVMALAVDAQNFLWVGGHDGCFRSRLPLYASQKLSFEQIKIPGLPSGAAVRQIVADADKLGTIWMATSNGLARLEGDRWSVFTTRDGLKSDSINALAERNGAVWLVYRADLGLTRLEANRDQLRITHFTTADGLASNVIFAIALDREGNPWITTDTGADYWREGLWRHLGTADGLVWDDTDDRALSIDETGRVWIGTSQGLSSFNPAMPVPSLPSAATVLTSASSGAHSWLEGVAPVLRYANSVLSLRFSSLLYATQGSERFRYRLNGFEDSWIETTEKSVQYAGLPAGQYTFEVEASRPDGSWDDTPARFAFSIKSPMWLTWWFYTLVLLAAALAGTAFWRYRVRSLIALQHLLEKEVLDRTEELRISHEQLREIAYRDALTLLPNRRLFTDQLRLRFDSAVQRNERFALLLLDLDHFKQVNDDHGHDTGDAVLVEVAERFHSILEPNEFVARLGGDEFALLVPTASHSALEILGSRITDVLSQTMQIGATCLRVGCSTGAAIFPDDAVTQEALYKAADVALYRAKRRNRAVRPAEVASTEPLLQVRAAALAAASEETLA